MAAAAVSQQVFGSFYFGKTKCGWLLVKTAVKIKSYNIGGKTEFEEKKIKRSFFLYLIVIPPKCPR